ncbi:MAG: response regulator, partial [Pseudorhodoplanes sp.]
YLKEVLSDLNIQIIYTRFGKEAIRMAEVNKPDVLLMDIHLPELTGVEATRRIRALPGTASGIPIIGISALASDGDRARAHSAGMNAYLVKPVVPARLAEALAQFRPQDAVT